MCDPRCSGSIAGGPLTDRIGVRDGLIAWADGADVLRADDVMIRGHDRSSYEPLQRGRTLKTGDLLALRPGSALELRTRDGAVLRTPRKGYAKGDEQPAVFMMISGEQALQEAQPVPPNPRVAAAQRERIGRILAAPWAAAGEGGTPLTDQQRNGYRYSDAELDLTDLRKRGLSTPAIEAEIRKLKAEQESRSRNARQRADSCRSPGGRWAASGVPHTIETDGRSCLGL